MVMGKGQPEKAREYMNWCFQIGVLEKTLESPLDCKEIQPVHPKGHQSWIFIGRTDAEAEAPVLWPPDVKNRLYGTDPDAGKGWGQEEKGVTEDEMVRWHHRLDGHESEQTLGDGEGQGSLVCCSHGIAKTRTWLSDWITANVSPITWHSGKSQAEETIRWGMVSGEGKGVKWMDEAVIFGGGETTLQTIMMDPRQHAFVQTHRMDSATCRLWILDDDDTSTKVHQLSTVYHLIRVADNEGGFALCRAQWVHGKSLDLFLKFAGSLKWL